MTIHQSKFDVAISDAATREAPAPRLTIAQAREASWPVLFLGAAGAATAAWIMFVAWLVGRAAGLV